MKKLVFLALTLFLSRSGIVLAQTPNQIALQLVRIKLEQRFVYLGDFDTVSLLARYALEDHGGYLDTAGNERKVDLAEPVYPHTEFTNGYAIAVTVVGNTKFHYIIDRRGKVVTALKAIDIIRESSNIDRIIAQDVHGKYGVIDRHGKTVVPFRYYLLESLDSNLLVAYVGEQMHTKQGVIDYRGKWIVPPLYTDFVLYSRSADYLLAWQDHDLVVRRGTWEKRIPNAFAYDPEPSRMTVDLEKGILLDRNDPTRGVAYTLNLDTIRPLTEVDDVVFLSEGLFGVRNWQHKDYDSLGRLTGASGADFGFADRTGTIVIPMIYSSATAFTEGFSIVNRNSEGLYGYINRKGEEVIPRIYQRALPFHHGFAKVMKDGKYFVIDKQGGYVMDARPF